MQGLQNYVAKLNWLQPEQVAEAYNLLNNLREPISITVCIALLYSANHLRWKALVVFAD